MIKNNILCFQELLAKLKINYLTVFVMTYLAVIIHASTPPIFITTLSNFQTSTWVLTTTNPVTTSGYSNQNTNVTYINLYTSVPNIGYGLGFLNSNYLTTLALDQYVFDIQIVQQLQASSLIQLNWTAGTIQQISLNYIVCDSSFWLDVRQTLVDLSAQTVYLSYTSTRTVVMTLPYKSKSNSSNAQVVYNSIGMDMIRTSSHTYQFQMMTSGKDFSTFNITLQIQTNNKIRWIRLCTYSYQSVATTINPPYFIDWGFISSFSGSIPDSSGLTLTSTGTIYTGMVNWYIDDSNTILNYNLALNLKSYTLTTTSLSQVNFIYIWYRMESCPAYTFLNGTVCDPCDYTCLTCANGLNTSCLTCPLTRQYVSTNHSCVCVTNYVDVGTTACAQLTCSATCLTCSYINQCGSCLSSLQRYLNGTQCVCNPYKIDVFNSTGDTYCYPCYYNCYTCSVSLVQTACLSCSSSKDHRYYVAANNTCVCLDKYYNNASSPSPVCGSCQYSCQTCTTNTACVTCNATKGRTYNSTTGFCSCVAGNYDDLLNQQCVACSITCLTCNSLGCLTCNTTTRILNGTACKCLDGYYDDGVNAACQLCYYPCATCSNSTNICTSCNNALQRYFSNNTCICANNYYSQVGLQLCLNCDVTCLTCVNASSSGCLSCDATNFRVYASSAFQCNCQNGYFQASPLVALCSICQYTCSTCANATQCLTCDALKFRVMNSSNLCACKNKYYDNGNQLCLACNYICLTCSSNLICDTCDTATRNATNLTTCPCLQGFYDNGISSSCLPCLAQCLTCTNGNNCTSCPSNKVLTATKDCVCANGTYYPSCLPCQYSCQQCASTANNCTQCNGTAMRYLNLSTSQCLCYQGYFSDGVTQQCQTCYYSCLTCSSYSSCDTCPTNRISNGSFCSCISQYYQNPSNKNCLPCHYSCQQCSAYTQCTSCSAVDLRYAKIPLSLCTCMDGYYDNFISELCYACDTRCQTCSAFSTCLSCNSTLNRYFVNSTFQCLCLSGYYEDSTTFLCVKCQYSCATCLNGNQCQTCPVGRTLSLTTGFCICNNGTFDNPSTLLCSLCSYPCLLCSGTSTTCTSCDSTRTLITANSTCQCLTHTFDNGTACQNCLSTCAQCINSYSCTSCLLGSNRNLDGNNLCPCIYGYYDSNGSLLTCLKCHYSCLTCSNFSTCDTCYPGRISQPGGLCYCPVNNYYDDGVNGACIPCSYSCLQCSKSPSNCTSCLSSANRYLFGASCICNEGYYDNNVVNCIKCEYSCMSCSTASACTGCNSSYERVFVTGPYCDCLIGYFDNSISQACDPCDYKCASCQTTSTNCLTCPSTRTFNSTGNTCPCNIHLYDSGLPTCQPCQYSCDKCLNNAQCTACPSTRYLQSTTHQCLCFDGYYNVINQLQCSTCYPLCLTCSDYQTCTNCDTSTNLRILFNSQCVCQNGYYDIYLSQGNATCQKCQYSCQNCVSATQCSSCSSIAFRIYNVTTLLCSCSNGYYDDTINTQCLQCSFDCLTCSSATVCLTCLPQRTLVSNRCDCSTSYYANGTVCQVCPPQCSACTNSSYCTACNGARILVNNTCICNVGYFIIPSSALCSACQYSCQSCVSYSACSSCNSSMQRYLSGSYCKCKALYYDDNTTQPCHSCQYSCKTCINGSKCLSCDSTLNRVYNLATSLCDCANGFYEDSTKLCIQCHYTCVTCNNGSACQSCNSLYLRTLNTTSYQCQCPLIGYYDDFINALCQTCDYRCLSCQVTSTTCTSCLNTTYRSLVVSSCTCIVGYYQILSLICPKCSYKCVTCQGAADNCTTCSAANQRSVTPNCSCAVGFYDNGVNSLCQSCDYRCQTCINGITCQTCNSTNNRIINNQTFMCDCMPVFYDDGSNPICVTCHYTCVTCNHPTICLTCPTTRTYNNGTCQCIAQHYDDGSSLQCLSCQYSCKACTNSTQCSACDNTYFRLFNTTTRYCSCNIRYYDNGLSQQLCLACQKTCLTCTNSSGCATCPSNINKTLNLTASPYCTCLYGYYQNYTAGALINQSSVCYKCYYSCQICVNLSTTCTVCNAADNRYLTSAHQCLCNSYYYDDGVNQACVNCYNTCLTCFGTGFSQCLTCDNNSYFLNSSCYSTCPSYYRNAVSSTSGLKICQLCTPYCVSCLSAITVCTLCQPTHRLFAFNSSSILCLDAAPEFYYDNGTEFLPCISPCLHCTAKYKCIDCIPQYYLDIAVTKYCYKCNDFCQSCNGPTAFDCISCINSYFLNNGLCTKLSCSVYQYVNSLTGCTNCSTSYPHSLTCTSLNILTCQTNYILSSSQTVCQTCSSVSGFKLSVSGTCVQICGDGIVINDLCDDGNTLNGDGCSSTCNIQKGWTCTNSSSCTLTQTPVLTVIQVVKILSQNKVQLTLSISIGVRLVTQNFALTFTPALAYTYNVYATNSQFTQYVLEIYYQSTAQNSNLTIQIISPITPHAQITNNPLYSPNQRNLVTVAPLSISLNIQIDLIITTQPPAEFISNEVRMLYSQVLFAILLSLHLIILLEIIVVVYKGIRVMLLSIDLYQHITILYLLCTFASYNILELIITSGSSLQPFIYSFGPSLSDITSNYFHFNYTNQILSACIIQVVILISYVLYQTFSKNQNNSGHYYYTSFLYVFYVDLMIACLGTFLYVQFQGYLTIYSWAIAFILFIIVNIYSIVYLRQGSLYLTSIKSSSKQSKGKIVVPSSSYITSQLELKQKQSNFMENVLGFDLQSSHDGKSKLSQTQKQQSDGNKTEVLLKYSQQKSLSHSQNQQQLNNQKSYNKLQILNKDSYFYKNIIHLYDLLPSSSNIQSTDITNKIGKYHILIQKHVFPLLIVIFISIQDAIIRSSLLFSLFVVILIIFYYQKVQSIKTLRSVKLFVNYLTYIIISFLLLIASSLTLSSYTIFNTIIAIIVPISLAFNIIVYIINIRYSNSYKEYLIQLRNNQILIRNQEIRGLQSKKKIYTNVYGNSGYGNSSNSGLNYNNGSPIKNIVRNYHNKNPNIYQQDENYQVSANSQSDQENSDNEQNYNKHPQPQSISSLSLPKKVHNKNKDDNTYTHTISSDISQNQFLKPAQKFVNIKKASNLPSPSNNKNMVTIANKKGSQYQYRHPQENQIDQAREQIKSKSKIMQRKLTKNSNPTPQNQNNNQMKIVDYYDISPSAEQEQQEDYQNPNFDSMQSRKPKKRTEQEIYLYDKELVSKQRISPTKNKSRNQRKKQRNSKEKFIQNNGQYNQRAGQGQIDYFEQPERTDTTIIQNSVAKNNKNQSIASSNILLEQKQLQTGPYYKYKNPNFSKQKKQLKSQEVRIRHNNTKYTNDKQSSLESPGLNDISRFTKNQSRNQQNQSKVSKFNNKNQNQFNKKHLIDIEDIYDMEEIGDDNQTEIPLGLDNIQVSRARLSDEYNQRKKLKKQSKPQSRLNKQSKSKSNPKGKPKSKPKQQKLKKAPQIKRQKIDLISDISSIKQQRELFMQEGLQELYQPQQIDEKNKMTVFNKILKDYQKYKNKKVDPKVQKIYQQNLQKLNRQYHPQQPQQEQSAQSQSQQNQQRQKNYSHQQNQQ